MTSLNMRPRLGLTTTGAGVGVLYVQCRLFKFYNGEDGTLIGRLEAQPSSLVRHRHLTVRYVGTPMITGHTGEFPTSGLLEAWRGTACVLSSSLVLTYVCAYILRATQAKPSHAMPSHRAPSHPYARSYVHSGGSIYETMFESHRSRPCSESAIAPRPGVWGRSFDVWDAAVKCGGVALK
jgi:hypothetical protein